MNSLQKLKSMTLALFVLLAMSFKVTGQQSPPPFIEILQPNAPGVHWVIGSEVLIAWNHNFVFDVKVELYDYTDVNNPVITMINPSVLGTTTPWLIDPMVFTPGDKYKIRVTSNILDTPDTRAESDNYFTLGATAGGTILVEQPNLPNTKWLRGNPHLISWVTDLQENVKLELYSATPFLVHSDEANNYGVWAHGSNEGTGFGPWAISTGTAGDGVAEFGFGDPADATITMENPAFRIFAHIGETDPQFGNFVHADREFVAPLEVEQRFVLDWGVHFATGNKGFILYSGGIGGTPIITIDYSSSGTGIQINGNPMFSGYDGAGSLKMTTYFEYEAEGSLRVHGVGRDGVETFNQVFAVAGAPDAIRFFSEDHNFSATPATLAKRPLFFNNLRIESYTMEIAASVPSSTHIWPIPANFRIGNDYKIRVSSTIDETIFDESDNFFSIVATLGGDIEVLQPTATDIWLRGNQYLISWIDDVYEPLNVHLWKNGSFHSVIQNNVVGSTLVWSIGGMHDIGDDFQIRVFSSIDGSIQAFSDFFEIVAVMPGGNITLFQPNEPGIYWVAGNTYLISWTDNIAETVDIDLMEADGTTLVRSLFTNVVGSTKYWPIPQGETPGMYKIRVKSSLVPNDVFAVSANAFEIGILPPDAFMLMHQPNVSGITWLRGHSYLISWSHNIWPDGRVNLYLERDDAFAPPLQIANNLLGSTWVWDIPIGTDIYDGYRIRAVSVDDPSLSAVSAFPFSISNFLPGGELEVLQPNGGEMWLIDHAYLVSWIGNYTGNVNVYLYKGAVEVDQIAMNIPGTTVTYTVPDNVPAIVPGNDYRVYIENVFDPSVNDFSDGFFSIEASAGGTVQVLNPEAGDIWFRGHQYFISWIDDLIEDVDIYLYKGGFLLEPIATDVPGSTYIWTIPNHLALGTDYQVRVQSSIDPIYYGESGLFEITLQVVLGIYPNPAQNQFTVQFSEMANEVYNLELTNRFGLPIYRTTVNADASKQTVVPVYDLPDGVYFLRIMSDNVYKTEKVVIKR